MRLNLYSNRLRGELDAELNFLIIIEKVHKSILDLIKKLQ